MYQVYFDDMLLPIAPQKIQMQYGNQNKTVNLINGEEVNIIRPPGLCEISFDMIFPMGDYPFAVWDGSVDDAEEFVSRLQELKEDKSSFEFIVIREGSGRRELFDTNMDVTLEDYKVADDAKEGMDLTISISLKEYSHYGTKVMNFLIAENTQQATEAEQPRTEPEADKTYTVQGGDSLWKIAKSKLNDGARWPEIFNLNRDKISNPDRINIGQVLTLP